MSENLGTIADIVGILGAIFALLAWIMTTRINRAVREEQKRKEKQVTVKLTNGGNSYTLPVKLRGDEISRIEVLGRIGMIPIKAENAISNKSPRFSITYTSGDEFMRRLNEVIDETNDTVLEISCTDEEFKQFDVTKSQEISE